MGLLHAVGLVALRRPVFHESGILMKEENVIHCRSPIIFCYTFNGFSILVNTPTNAYFFQTLNRLPVTGSMGAFRLKDNFFGFL